MIDELQAEFAKEFTGIGFNFSQYIQDNVEEGLSGVRGANSAKIIGPDLVTLGKARGRRRCMRWRRSKASPISGFSGCSASPT